MKELSNTSGQVSKLEKAKNDIEQTVLTLETKYVRRAFLHSLKDIKLLPCSGTLFPVLVTFSGRSFVEL